jgi:glycosyltransferase involved in cell wall biosynthesis
MAESMARSSDRPWPAPLAVAAFTGGEDVPSARFRVRQYLPALGAMGVAVRELPSRVGAYPPPERSRRVAWAVRNLCSRLVDLARARGAAVSLLQREFVATTVTLEALTPRPRVLDVDDAIWVYGGEAFARRLARLCDLVVCGNGFLAEQFARWHGRVEVLPTAVDTDRFRPGGEAPRGDAPVIGWTGTASTLPYLHAIERPLGEILRRHPRATLRVVCDRPPELPSLGGRVAFVRWSPAVEVRAIQDMAVGLMPLEDSIAARGKCSLKMLLYMACEVPVVVSPIGANRDVLSHGEVGFAASSADDWVDAIDLLLREPERARAIGVRGRGTVEEHFSVRTLAPRLAALLRSVAG